MKDFEVLTERIRQLEKEKKILLKLVDDNQERYDEKINQLEQEKIELIKENNTRIDYLLDEKRKLMNRYEIYKKALELACEYIVDVINKSFDDSWIRLERKNENINHFLKEAKEK